MSRILDRVLGADRPEAIRPRSRSVYEPGLEITAAESGAARILGPVRHQPVSGPLSEPVPTSTGTGHPVEAVTADQRPAGAAAPSWSTVAPGRPDPARTAAQAPADAAARGHTHRSIVAVEVSAPRVSPDVPPVSFPVRPPTPAQNQSESAGAAGRAMYASRADRTPRPGPGEGHRALSGRAVESLASGGPGHPRPAEPIRPVPRPSCVEASMAPIVRVTIGQVDIRAAVPAATVASPRPAARPGPALSLADYLAARAGEPRR